MHIRKILLIIHGAGANEITPVAASEQRQLDVVT